MNHHSKEEKIEKLSRKLVDGFHWMNNHPDDVDGNLQLIGRALPIFRQLRRVGITQQACWDALLSGLPIKEHR